MVAEAGRTELTRAASTRRCSPGTRSASPQPVGWRDARGLNAPLGAGRRGDRETPVHDEHAIRREPGTRTDSGSLPVLARIRRGWPGGRTGQRLARAEPPGQQVERPAALQPEQF